MLLSTLLKLKQFFLQYTKLNNSQYIDILEKIAMFMHIVGHKYIN